METFSNRGKRTVEDIKHNRQAITHEMIEDFMSKYKLATKEDVIAWMKNKNMINQKVLEFAKQNNIYTNEAERVLAGEITLDEAKAITAEFNKLVESGEVRLVAESDIEAALTECAKLSNK